MIDASYASTAAATLHGTLAEEDPGRPPTQALALKSTFTAPLQAAAALAVDTAVAAVQGKLREVAGGALGKVHDIAPTVTALPPADRNTLVSRLSDPELSSWLETTGRQVNPGDQRALFDSLAQGLDDKQLGRVIASLDRDHTINGANAAIVGRLGDAIAANKSAAELQQFVQSSAGQVEGDQKTALIVAKALDALGAQATPSTYAGGIPYTPPNHFEPALAALSPAQLNSVARAQQAVGQAQQQQITNDARNALQGEKGVALAVHLRQIEQASGSEAAAQAFAAFAAAEPALAAQAVAEFEQDKVDGSGANALAPDGFTWENVRDVYADPGAVNKLIRQGNAVLGQGNPAAVDAYTAALSNRLLNYGSANNTLLYSNVASDIAGSGSEALQRSFVKTGMGAADAWLGDSGAPLTEPVASFVSALGQVASQSPTVARDVFDYTQSHDLGQAKRGTAAFEAVLQIFATEGTALPSGQTPSNSLKPSYLGYMDALLGPGAAQGALSPRDALTVFETVSSSGEVWPTDTTLLAQGDLEGGSRGTAQMAKLFEAYLPQWINAGSDSAPANLIAGVGTGTLNDHFDKAFTNFMDKALFDPEENGAYRQPLTGSLVRNFGDLASGKLGQGMDAEARGRLVGGLMSILDKGFAQYADQIRSDAETQKSWASFGIGLAFSLVPGVKGAKVAEIIVSQGQGKGEEVVTDTANQLIDAGVDRVIAKAAAEAANRGETLAAFEQLELGLSPDAKSHVAEYNDLQKESLASGKKTLGELFRDVFGDNDISPDGMFRGGVSEGWRQVHERAKPG